MKFIKIILITVLVAILNQSVTFGQENTGQIIGRVISEMTGNPIPGITIRVEGTQSGAMTKNDGTFQIKGLKPGVYAVKYTGIGFNQFIQSNISVTNVKPVQLEVKLSEKIIELGGVEVRGSFFVKQSETVTSTQTLNAEDVRHLPGGNEDVVQALGLLPGVGIPGPGRNDLLVRGGAPFENLFIVDNIEIPNINHFGSQGSTGGPLSIINIDFVNNVSFSAGGFGAKYGDKLSSITNINLRNGNEEKFGGKAILSATGFGLYFEGPIGSTGSYLFSARRSYLDFIFKAAGLGFIPQYWDFTGKVNFRLDDRNTVTFLTIGALDKVVLNNNSTDNMYKNSKIASPNQDQYFSGITWKHLFGSGFSTVTLGRSFVYFNTFQNDSNLVQIFKNISYEGENSLKTDFDFQLSPRFELSFGNLIKWASKLNYSVIIPGYLRTDAAGIPQPLTVDSNLTSLKNATYLSLTTSLGQYKITLGGRFDYINFTENKLFFSPRLSMIYQVNPVSAVIFSGGRYFQAPSYIWRVGAPNQKLNPMKADQLVLGYEHTPLEDIKVQLEFYYKWYSDYPARIYRPEAVLSPTGYDDASYDIPYGLEPLSNTATGWSKGVELSIQKKLTPELPLYGIFSITYSQTKFKSLDGIERLGSFDSPLLLNFSAGYRIENDWEFSLKYRAGVGYPTTPFLVTGLRNFIKYNEGDRLPFYKETDIRIDKRWNMANFALVTYLDVANIFGTKNKTDVRWDYRTNSIVYDESFGVLPSIGVQFEF